MIEKNKIVWRKPTDYSKVPDKEIDKHCIENISSGDIIIERNQYGRKVTFVLYRVEKVGELIEGIDTLSRQRAIEELKTLLKLNKQEETT